MADMRVKLTFPDDSIFETKIPVSIADINYGGHMGNDRFLTMMQEARIQWLKSLGYKNEKEIAPPVGMIVADAAIQYKSEVFHGEIISVRIAVSNPGTRGFDLFYEMSAADGRITAIAKTAILFINYETKKLSTIPEAFAAKSN